MSENPTPASPLGDGYDDDITVRLAVADLRKAGVTTRELAVGALLIWPRLIHWEPGEHLARAQRDAILRRFPEAEK